MEAGLADHAWSIDELLALVSEPTIAPFESKFGRRRLLTT